jgi:hypothetical protein
MKTQLIKPNPGRHTLPPNWRYVKAEDTDVSKTIRNAAKRYGLAVPKDKVNERAGNEVCGEICS